MTAYLTIEELILLHDRQARARGGLECIRDLGLLASAIDMPKTTFDGNRRTGAFAPILFLRMNGIKLDLDSAQYENLVILTIKGLASKTQINRFFKKKKIGYSR